MEKESVYTESSTANGGGWRTSPRTTLQPALILDSRVEETRPGGGLQLSYMPAWSAAAPFSAIDTMQQAAQLRIHRRYPLTHGRNEVAFKFVAAVTRPLGSGPLPLERRLYPDDRLVRGFPHGALSAWSYDPALSDSSMQLQPSGADTVLGLSSEYRVPIHGRLSGAAFLDFGWTGLTQRDTEGTPAILSKTNRLLRASTGGELRLLIPGLNQPARLIFSWNPLRLNSAFLGSSGIRSLADPRRSIRFALGNVF